MNEIILLVSFPKSGNTWMPFILSNLFKKDEIVSVCEMDHSPLWSNTLPQNRSMGNFLREEVLNKRSQDLEKYYRINGAIYICKTERLLKEKSFFLKDNIFAYQMDRKSSVDIDEEIDFRMAEVLKKYDMNLRIKC